MKRLYENFYKNNEITVSELLSCLVTCEKNIKTKTFCAHYEKAATGADSSTYDKAILEWITYREKIQKALQRKYDMGQIVAMPKAHRGRTCSNWVKVAVEQIDTGDFVLL